MKSTKRGHLSLFLMVVSLSVSSGALALDDPFWKKLKNTGSRMEVFGDYSAAATSYRQAIAAAEKAGADRLVISELTVRLATALVTQGKLREAEPYYKSTLDKVPAFIQDGTRQEDLLACVDALAESYSEQSTGPRAIFCLEHQIKLLESAFTQGHPRLVACLLSLSDIYLRLGEYDRATELLKQVLRVTRKDIPKREVHRLRAELILGHVLERKGRYAEAAAMLEHALNYAFTHKLGGSMDSPSTNALLAVCYLNGGRTKDAQQLFELTDKQFRITQSQLAQSGKKRELVTLTCETCFWAAMYFAFNKTRLASEMSKRAIELVEINLGPEDSALIEPLDILARIERQKHNQQAAARYEQRITAIKNRYLSMSWMR